MYALLALALSVAAEVVDEDQQARRKLPHYTTYGGTSYDFASSVGGVGKGTYMLPNDWTATEDFVAGAAEPTRNLGDNFKVSGQVVNFAPDPHNIKDYEIQALAGSATPVAVDAAQELSLSGSAGALFPSIPPIVVIPVPPPLPPCSMAAWKHELAPHLGPPGSAAVTTRDVCDAICPRRKDVSPDFMPSPWTGVKDYSGMGANRGVCIIATQVYGSHIMTTDRNDCVFICEVRSTELITLDGKDQVYYKKATNNVVALGPGDDRAVLKPARFNTVLGETGFDKIYFEGDHNKVDSGDQPDKIGGRGMFNKMYGGRDNDFIQITGDQNVLEGADDDDVLVVPGGTAFNTLDGGTHLTSAGDTCGSCAAPNVCMNCFP